MIPPPDDTSLWSYDDAHPLTDILSVWSFDDTPDQGGRKVLGLSIYTHLGHHLHIIHKAALNMLAFLDSCYWGSIAHSDSSLHNRIAHYLHRLREAVTSEIESTPQPRLIDNTWLPSILVQWAVRVQHGYGHSHYGRREYLLECTEMGWRPYQHEDPLLYGAPSSDRAPPVHVQNNSFSDWSALWLQRFQGPANQRAVNAISERNSSMAGKPWGQKGTKAGFYYLMERAVYQHIATQNSSGDLLDTTKPN